LLVPAVPLMLEKLAWKCDLDFGRELLLGAPIW
jgi:hypothetical protein